MIGALERIAAAMPLVLTVVVLAAALLAIALVVRVVRKAGYSPWWSIGVFVPGVNLVLLVMFATVRWPVERRLEDAERRLAGAPHLGGMTSYAALASAPPPAGLPARAVPASEPDPGSTPVRGTGAVAPSVLPVVAPPTFTPLPYPAGYGSPPAPVADARGDPRGMRPEVGG